MESNYPSAEEPASSWPWLQIDPIDVLFGHILRIDVGKILGDLLANDDPVDDDPVDDEVRNQKDDNQRDAENNTLVHREVSRQARFFRLNILVMCCLLCIHVGPEFSQDHNFSIYDLMNWTKSKFMDEWAPDQWMRFPMSLRFSKPVGNISEYFSDIACEAEYSFWYGYGPMVCYEREMNSTNHTHNNATIFNRSTTSLQATDNQEPSATKNMTKTPNLNGGKTAAKPQRRQRRSSSLRDVPWKRLLDRFGRKNRRPKPEELHLTAIVTQYRDPKHTTRVFY